MDKLVGCCCRTINRRREDGDSFKVQQGTAETTPRSFSLLQDASLRGVHKEKVFKNRIKGGEKMGEVEADPNHKIYIPTLKINSLKRGLLPVRCLQHCANCSDESSLATP
ncbi:hypothetical protein CEXT_330741 [Caerostris extrusa]|uniref:Uncharacterized protein n=1 Tax=Caerostris extrusa TaxID=172846 RepID=A0AAV4TF97_CAEEX|nr:hypothetical protein CEXT_330741 [Caerostris extrusa]